jgi:hypothetical protein
MPDRSNYFRCPLCRAVTCERVVVRRPNGTAYVTAFFSCTVCTLMFRDPLALTRGFEDRPRTDPKSPGRQGNPYQAWSKVNQDRKDRE